MGTLDVIILICLIPAIVQGIRKGFIAQLVSFISIIAGVWLAFHFSEIACQWLKQYMPDFSGTLLSVIGFLVVFFVVAVLFLLVGRIIKGVVKALSLGWLDWVLGLVFSLAKAALLIGLVIILFDTLNLKFELVKPEVIDQSVLYNPIKDFAYKVFPYFKALLFKQ